MGQKNATLAIVIDQHFAVAGSEISGKIYLSAQEKVEADCLAIRLIGQEKTCVKYTTSDKERSVSNYFHGQCRFLDMSSIITMFSEEGGVVAGQYEYPFKVRLPLGIAPSLHAVDPGENGGHCDIVYSLEAKLHKKGQLKWDIFHKRIVRVLPSPPPTPLTPPPPEVLTDPHTRPLPANPLRPNPFPELSVYAHPVQQKIYFCCCIRRGAMLLSMSSSRAFLIAGEEFDVSYLVHNQSNSDIKALEISVVEEVSWTAGGRRRTITKDLHHTRLDKNISQLASSPVVMQNLKQPQNMIGEYIVDRATLLQFKEILDSKRFAIHGSLGQTDRHELHGTLITCKHYLQLKVCTPFGTSNPMIISPIVVIPSIYSRQATSSSPLHSSTPTTVFTPTKPAVSPADDSDDLPTLPEDWRPTISDLVDLSTPVYVSPVLDPQETGEALPPSPRSQKIADGLNLLSSLRTTYFPLGELQVWIKQNSADSLTIKELQSIYKIISSPVEQLTATDLLVEHRTSFSCEEIVNVVRFCHAVTRIAVVKSFAGKCSNKDQKQILQRELLPIEYLCVEDALK